MAYFFFISYFSDSSDLFSSKTILPCSETTCGHPFISQKLYSLLNMSPLFPLPPLNVLKTLFFNVNILPSKWLSLYSNGMSLPLQDVQNLLVISTQLKYLFSLPRILPCSHFKCTLDVITLNFHAIIVSSYDICHFTVWNIPIPDRVILLHIF